MTIRPKGLRTSFWLCFFLVMPFSLTGLRAQTSAVVLITDEEASRPRLPNEFKDSIERGPKVRMISPSNGAAHSPLRFVIQFQSFGGRVVDPQSVRVTYLTNPTVNLTERLRAYITPTGISIDAASVPHGLHPLQIELKDAEGHFGIAEINLVVE